MNAMHLANQMPIRPLEKKKIKSNVLKNDGT
jgi:hypothetical protein